MDRISAADNLVIELEAEHWRLIANGDGGRNVLVEAQPGQPLRYIPNFAISRRLPEIGALPTDQIQRVVLGWSGSDAAWHLGLVLRPELAEARGSRWCEVASWPDPDRSVYDEVATRAGETLAQSLTRPFYLVPPKTVTETVVPQKPLLQLPLTVDIWTLQGNPKEQLEWVRAASWTRQTVRRILWYMFLTAIYTLLVVTSFTAGIAPVTPQVLPYLGIFSIVVLISLIIYHIYLLLTRPNRIVMDKATRTVRALRGTSERWRMDADKLQSVYVTHVMHKSNRRSTHNKPVAYYSELNLQLLNGEFHYILNTDQAQEYRSFPEDLVEEEAVKPLTPNDSHTPIQAAGLYMAQILGISCWYDKRF